jgi:hypothetical protein
VSDSVFNLDERVAAAMAELPVLERQVAVAAMVRDASDYRLRSLVAWAGEWQRMGVSSVQDRQRQRVADALERAVNVLRSHGLTADHLRRASALSAADWDDTQVDNRATTCAECGADLPRRIRPGRPRRYCSHACRERAYRARHSRE